jgi:hypothetical protein
MTKNWTIVGKDLLSVVSCKEPYEWKDPTGEEWEFNDGAKKAAGGKQFKVRRTREGGGCSVHSRRNRSRRCICEQRQQEPWR